jgi:2-oxoglutarate ferredoxin oxidoreductase subunit beta
LYSQLLATMGLPDFPTPLGVIRHIHRPTYETLIHDQVEAAKTKRGTGSWQELLHGTSTWTVE